MFENLIGNENAKDLLKKLVRGGRLPQSLLFEGRPGVGKRLFAIEMAKALVCTDLRDGLPCDECSACLRAAAFRYPKPDDRDAHREVIFSGHPDVGMIVPYNQTIYIDAIRSLEREANFRPYEARARFFVIDDAEKLSSVKDNSANALLKTLEEPAETTHIVLVTSRPLLLLSTIRSRCQAIRFGRISKDEISRHLTNDLNYPSEDAALVAGLSRGSLGLALGTDLEKFRSMRMRLLDVITRCSRRDNFAVLLRASEELCDPKAKDDYAESLHILQALIHDVWTLKKKEKPEIVNFDLRRELDELASGTESERLVRWLSQIEELRENLNFNLNRKLATDALFMGMAA